MKVSPIDFYDETYFYHGEAEKKPYTAADGTIKHYVGPAGDWHGYEYVLDFIEGAIPLRGMSMLDLGCGCGGFVARARARGVRAVGCDISQWAIGHPVSGAEGFLHWRDLSEVPPGLGTFDLVTGLDLLEHIYEEDLDSFLQNIFGSVMPYGRMFFDICTVKKPADEFVLRKGAEVPIEKESIAVAGHVNVRPFEYWLNIFGSYQWKIDWSTMDHFHREWSRHPEMQKVEAWGLQNVLCVRRP